jgi:hypothetical protein
MASLYPQYSTSRREVNLRVPQMRKRLSLNHAAGDRLLVHVRAKSVTLSEFPLPLLSLFPFLLFFLSPLSSSFYVSFATSSLLILFFLPYHPPLFLLYFPLLPRLPFNLILLFLSSSAFPLLFFSSSSSSFSSYSSFLIILRFSSFIFLFFLVFLLILFFFPYHPPLFPFYFSLLPRLPFHLILLSSSSAFLQLFSSSSSSSFLYYSSFLIILRFSPFIFLFFLVFLFILFFFPHPQLFFNYFFLLPRLPSYIIILSLSSSAFPLLFSSSSSSSFSSYSSFLIILRFSLVFLLLILCSLQSPNSTLVLVNVLTRTVVHAGSTLPIQKLASRQVVLFIRSFLLGGLVFITLALFQCD